MVLGPLADTLPAFPLDKSVRNANTGVLLLDCLPLLTMIPTIPTLRLYWRRKRFGDLAFFGVGFWLVRTRDMLRILCFFWGPGGCTDCVASWMDRASPSFVPIMQVLWLCFFEHDPNSKCSRGV
jgi:hypothetical protein